MTVPPACPQCRGSGLRFEWLGYPPEEIPAVPYWWLWETLGYFRLPCPLCNYRGSLAEERMPAMDPADWHHRIPDEVKEGLQEAC